MVGGGVRRGLKLREAVLQVPLPATPGLLQTKEVVITFGPESNGRPIDLSEFYGREADREVLEQVTLRIMKAMAQLGGEPDFQPSSR